MGGGRQISALENAPADANLTRKTLHMIFFLQVIRETRAEGIS